MLISGGKGFSLKTFTVRASHTPNVRSMEREWTPVSCLSCGKGFTMRNISLGGGGGSPGWAWRKGSGVPEASTSENVKSGFPAKTTLALLYQSDIKPETTCN